MSTPRVILTWIDNNQIETGHRIYRSDTPMDIQNMPTPIVTLGENITVYRDEDVIEGNFYYYRVSAFTTNAEEFSSEVYAEATTGTIDIHDLFFDGSAVVTYQMDGNADDLGGNYNGVWSGNESYTTGIINQSSVFDGNSFININNPNLISINQSFSLSVWFKTFRNSSASSALGGFLARGRVRTGGRNYGISMGIDNNGLNLWRGNGGTTELSHIAGGQLTTNVWYHAVFNYDINTGISELFLNNSSLGNKDIGNSNITYISSFDPNVFRVGDYASISGFEPYQGEIDQMRLFNRPLTTEEVEELYNEQS